MGVDELPSGCRIGELLPESPHVDVDRTVTRSERAPPSMLREFLAAYDGAGPPGQGDEETELVAGQVERRRADARHVLRRTDLQRPCAQDLVQRSFHGSEPASISANRGYSAVNHL